MSIPRLLPMMLIMSVVAPAGADGPSGVDAEGFITSWLVLAPIPFPHVPTGTAELGARQIPDEATMRPAAGQYVRLKDRELVWLEHQAPAPAIDFTALADPGRSLESLGYAVTTLVADQARTVRLLMGSSKQAKVYLNGAAVLVNERPRPYLADEDAVEVRLARGANSVVFKVVNTGGAWRGSLRLVDATGGPAPGVKASLHPRLEPGDLFPLDAQGYIRSWITLAPIAYVPPTVGKGQSARDLLPAEALLRPREGDSVRVGDKELRWRAVRAQDFFLDFSAVAGPGDWRAVAGYAVAYVIAPEAMSGLTLKAGSNDQGRVYLNGKPVVTYDAPRALRRDQDVVHGIALRKGTNVVVFKVLNTERKWQACLRFADAGGRAVTNLRVVQGPPAS